MSTTSTEPTLWTSAPISGIIVQHIDNGYKHLVMMMMWHHGMANISILASKIISMDNRLFIITGAKI